MHRYLSIRKIVFVSLLFFITGCATTSGSLSIGEQVSIGMTKSEVIDSLGTPYKTSSRVDIKTGKKIEILTYKEHVKPNWITALQLENDVVLRDGRVVSYDSYSMDY